MWARIKAFFQRFRRPRPAKYRITSPYFLGTFVGKMPEEMRIATEIRHEEMAKNVSRY